jgi:hypothetical protein
MTSFALMLKESTEQEKQWPPSHTWNCVKLWWRNTSSSIGSTWRCQKSYSHWWRWHHSKAWSWWICHPICLRSFCGQCWNLRPHHFSLVYQNLYHACHFSTGSRGSPTDYSVETLPSCKIQLLLADQSTWSDELHTVSILWITCNFCTNT